jgi:hypothetical protein
MDLAALKFTGEDAMEKLDQLREILGLSETDAEYEISLEATPLYQSTALAALKDVLATREYFSTSGCRKNGSSPT